MEMLLVGLLQPVIGIVVVAFVAYWVIRRAVRDGMLDATELDRELAAERKPRQMPTASTPAPESR